MPATDLFVGRDRELAELGDGLDSVLAGRGRLFLLTGEPGIGKTRLADELSAVAADRGAHVLWGRALEGGGAPAFWPWIQVLRSLVGGAGSSVDATAVHQLLPERRDARASSVESDARFELFDRVYGYVRARALERPLAVVLDDLHAVDQATLLLLEFCARELRDVPILIIGTHREAEVHRDPQLGELLGRISREGRTIALRGLADTAVAHFLRSTTGRDPDDRLVVSFRRATGGNPLFISETVGLLSAEGRLDATVAEIPIGVREAIRQRLRPLGARVQSVLEAAAVLGPEFSIFPLLDACDIGGDDVRRALTEAVDAGIVAAEGRGVHRFRHVLIRETLYEAIDESVRRDLHRRLALVIERRNDGNLAPHLAELAHHFLAALPVGDTPTAGRYARAAGHEALAVLAYEEAADWYSRALDVAGTSEHAQRCELLLALSEARWKAGEQELARDAFADAAALARRLDEPVLLARAALGFGAGGQTGHPDQRLLALLEEALDGLGDGHDELRARILARISLEVYYLDVERARALTAEAVELAQRAGDEPTFLYVLNARRNAIWGPEDLDERIAIATEVAKRGESAEIREFAMEGHVWRMLGLAETGDLAAMDRELEAITRIAGEMRQPLYLWELDLNRAARALASGRLDEAERFTTSAAARASEAQIPDGALAYGVQLFFIRDLQGRIGELEEAIEGFLDSYPQITALRTGVAYIHTEIGRRDDARVALDKLRSEGFVLPPDRHWLLAMALCALVCWRLGDGAAAADVYDLLRPYADRIVATTAVFSFGAVAHHLGLLAVTKGEIDVAVQHLDDALARHISTRNRPWVARTSLALAGVLLERSSLGDAERARTLARAALETSGELGMAATLQEARALSARVARSAPTAVSPTTADGTTTILFTDVVGSTELLERVGDIRAQEIMREHHRLVREEIANHDGTEARFQGDGFMIVFPAAGHAVRCAVAIQCRMASYSHEHPDTALRVRAGIHSGVPIVEDGELHGRSVVLAARIAGAADGGEILVSSRVHELVTSSDVVYGAARSVTLKGLEGTHTVHPVLWA